MTYSLDFRQRVMKIKEDEKLTYKETSQRFNVTMRSLFRWAQNIKPKKNRNKPATKIDMEKLAKDVDLYPDKFQYERAEDYGVSAWAIGLALKRLNQSRKKKLCITQKPMKKNA